MNRIIGIILLSALNILTSLATLGLLVLLFRLGDISLTEITNEGIGFVVLLIVYGLTEIIKWVVYVYILMNRRQKLWYYFVGYGLLIAFIAFFFQFLIPVMIGLLYPVVVYLLKRKQVTAENDYLLFDEEPVESSLRSNHDIPFVIGLTLLVIVSFYFTWTSLEFTMSVIGFNLKLGIVPLLHLLLSLLMSMLYWISLYNVIKDRKSKWAYCFAVLFFVDLTIVVWRTIELSQLEYFTSVFMLLDPVRIFMMAFNVIGFLLLIRKNQEIKEEVGL